MPRGYEFRNAVEAEETEILMYGQIGSSWWEEGIDAATFVKDLKELGEDRNLKIRINSPGGYVYDGIPIYNALKRHKGRVKVYIDGLAASIASVIAMAGDEVIMPENAMLMIHDPWSMAIGTAEDMRKSAEALEKVKDNLVTVYRDKTGIALSEISDLMAAETWMRAPEAKEKGFIDTIEGETPSEEPKALNLSDVFARFFAHYKNVPEGLKNSLSGYKANHTAGNPGVDHPFKTEGDPEIMTTPENNAGTNPPVINREYLIANHADLVQAFKNEGAQSERDRIQAVEERFERAGGGHKELEKALKYDGKTTGAEAADAILAAEAAVRQNVLKNHKDDAPDPIEQPTADPEVGKEEEPDPDGELTDEQIKAEWEKKKSVRDEFTSFERYRAWRRAESKGLARVKRA